MFFKKKPGFGWLPDSQDSRDWSVNTPEVKNALKLEKREPLDSTYKEFIDLRGGFDKIDNQGSIGSCTAHAAAGIIEYWQKRVYRKHVDPSRLFMYKIARKLDGFTGDTGAHLRTMMKGLSLIGAPPEEYMPYNESRWDVEPDTFQYSMARAFPAVAYFRLDTNMTPVSSLVERLKSHLRARTPYMFGFLVFDNYEISYSNGGYIPVPTSTSKSIGGHAVVVCGYDDHKEAFLIRNSWGTSWGSHGYGWLPYAYVNNGWAWDFWTITNAKFVDISRFK